MSFMTAMQQIFLHYDHIKPLMTQVDSEYSIATWPSVSSAINQCKVGLKSLLEVCDGNDHCQSWVEEDQTVISAHYDNGYCG